MIDSTSPSDRAARTAGLSADLTQKQTQRVQVDADRLSTDQAQRLQSALAGDPEIRPEVVARGAELSADPDYPPAAVVANVAGQIVNSPDLSEDAS